ncbi:MAG TPA: ATP-binding protein [Thermomicrobiales bacterium]|nr:ATP-binding protein [Thermomicrobiales bacterium]
MFRAISRRLAILNALVVIAVIAIVGVASYFYLAQRIETQTNMELRSRSASAVELWTNVFAQADANNASGTPSALADGKRGTNDDDDEDDDREEENEHQARELLRSGDTIAYGVDLDGNIISTLRPIEIEHLPREDSIERALQGEVVLETAIVEHERVRLRTEPVYADGRIIGAIQVGMGLGPNERLLEFVRWSTIGGLLLGVLLAVPAGWWLANRSMRPIREAFARQRSFVADAAHELRTPLTLIRAEAEYMQQTPELALSDRHESETAIVREVDSMANLVSSLLTLARMDEHATQFLGKQVDLSGICCRGAERFQSLAADRNISLELDANIPVTVSCDADATEQVLAILLDNAIAYTPNGGRVLVRTSMRAGKAVIEVSDTGIGISAEDQRRIFDRFYRADPARSRSSGGAGLGLSIATELMAAQRGSILVTSEFGSGSTFTLLFDTLQGHH